MYNGYELCRVQRCTVQTWPNPKLHARAKHIFLVNCSAPSTFRGSHSVGPRVEAVGNPSLLNCNEGCLSKPKIGTSSHPVANTITPFRLTLSDPSIEIDVGQEAKRMY